MLRRSVQGFDVVLSTKSDEAIVLGVRTLVGMHGSANSGLTFPASQALPIDLASVSTFLSWDGRSRAHSCRLERLQRCGGGEFWVALGLVASQWLRHAATDEDSGVHSYRMCGGLVGSHISPRHPGGTLLLRLEDCVDPKARDLSIPLLYEVVGCLSRWG